MRAAINAVYAGLLHSIHALNAWLLRSIPAHNAWLFCPVDALCTFVWPVSERGRRLHKDKQQWVDVVRVMYRRTG